MIVKSRYKSSPNVYRWLLSAQCLTTPVYYALQLWINMTVSAIIVVILVVLIKLFMIIIRNKNILSFYLINPIENYNFYRMKSSERIKYYKWNNKPIVELRKLPKFQPLVIKLADQWFRVKKTLQPCMNLISKTSSPYNFPTYSLTLYNLPVIKITVGVKKLCNPLEMIFLHNKLFAF